MSAPELSRNENPRPEDGSINTQLYNAVAAIARANDTLAHRRDQVARARQGEREALDEVDQAQRRFDALVALVKKDAPHESTWRRPVAMPTAEG